MKTFSEKVKEIVRALPRGQTRTYKEIATLAGSPNASRAVGSVMKKNFDTDIPCHRVIKSDGSIGEYNRGGKEMKQALLEKEKNFQKN
jgi:O-6-methylguanine DNA methyltransferase